VNAVRHRGEPAAPALRLGAAGVRELGVERRQIRAREVQQPLPPEPREDVICQEPLDVPKVALGPAAPPEGGQVVGHRLGHRARGVCRVRGGGRARVAPDAGRRLCLDRLRACLGHIRGIERHAPEGPLRPQPEGEGDPTAGGDARRQAGERGVGDLEPPRQPLRREFGKLAVGEVGPAARARWGFFRVRRPGRRRGAPCLNQAGEAGGLRIVRAAGAVARLRRASSGKRWGKSGGVASPQCRSRFMPVSPSESKG
jgi:hypothetical protein